MSLFDWFSGKKPSAVGRDSSDMQDIDKTRPLHPNRNQKAWVDVGDAQHAVNRKAERIEQRDLLYAVVRDTMVRVGVLSSRYKFKVLSLDQRGRQFLVMMDISPEVVSAQERLSEIEVMLAQTAKARHDILVTAVYWRFNNQVSVGAAQQRPGAKGTAAAASPKRFEPIAADEVAAFRDALQQAAASRPAPGGPAVQSGPRRSNTTGFEDTGMPEAEDSRPQVLSTTQYGDL
jgi:hypothetical protein